MKILKKQELEELQNVVGHAEVDGQVVVFVNKKLKMSTIQRKIKDSKTPWTEKDVIPKEVKTGIIKKKKTDVVEIGDVVAFADRKKYRPVIGGCEIGIYRNNYVGTAGLPVKVKKFRNLWLIGRWHSFLRILARFGIIAEDKVVLLTNSHVANHNVLEPGYEQITQPLSSMSSRIIGKVLTSVPIEESAYNEYDAALIEVIDTAVVDSIIEVGYPTGIDKCNTGDEVEKYGRTTSYTEGRCTARNVTMRIDYGEEAGVLKFKGLDMFTYMSDGGDSGSCIVRKNDKKAVSLLFAGSNTVTFGIPMQKVQSKLNFEVF